MAETVISPIRIAKRAALALFNTALLYRAIRNPDDRAEFDSAGVGPGATVKIRHPSTPNARVKSGDYTLRDGTQGSTSLTLSDTVYDKVAIPAKDLQLQLDDFDRLWIQPTMRGFAEVYASQIAVGIRTTVYNRVGTAADPPDSKADVLAVGAKLDNQKVPQEPRLAIMNPTGYADVAGIDKFLEAGVVGDAGERWRKGMLGEVAGFQWGKDQSIESHTAGTMAAETPLVDGVVAAGAVSMDIDDAGAGSHTILAGDLFTVADVDGEYVFTNSTTAVSGQITGATFSPEAPTGGFPDDKALTIIASHAKNVAYHPGAFTAVAVPASPTPGANQGYFFDEAVGVGVLVTFDKSMTSGATEMLFESHFGFATVKPSLATIVLG